MDESICTMIVGTLIFRIIDLHIPSTVLLILQSLVSCRVAKPRLTRKSPSKNIAFVKLFQIIRHNVSLIILSYAFSLLADFHFLIVKIK